MKYLLTIKDIGKNEDIIGCQCNAVIAGVAIEDKSVAFHLSGSDDEMLAVIEAINKEIEEIFKE